MESSLLLLLLSSTASAQWRPGLLSWQSPSSPSTWQPLPPSWQPPSWRPVPTARDAAPKTFSSLQHNFIDSSLVDSLHDPVLQVSSTEGFIEEGVEIGTTVRVSPYAHSESLQILVSDMDLKPGMPPATYQYVLSGPGAAIFAVDQRGFVYLNNNTLDADVPQPSTYLLTVLAREVDTSPTRSSLPVTISIRVLDLNDNAPRWEREESEGETTARGGKRKVAMMVATDRDSGTNGAISYSILQVHNVDYNIPLNTSLFWYDEESQSVETKDELVAGRYKIVVAATDGGGRSASASIRLTVVEEETASSLPLQPSTEEETVQAIYAEIPEDAPVGTVVQALGDSKLPIEVVYEISGGNEEDKFALNEKTGVLTVKQPLDREATAFFTLSVDTKTMGGQHLYWSVVQVAVTDVNDNPPRFMGTQPIQMEYLINREEDMRKDAVVGRVTVRDADGGDNGRFALGVLSPADELFSIDDDGLLTVRGDFSARHLGEHRVMVFARDEGVPPRESLASILLSIQPGPEVEIVTQMPPTEPPSTTTVTVKKETTTPSPPPSTTTLPSTTTMEASTTQELLLETTTSPDLLSLLSSLSSLSSFSSFVTPSGPSEGRLAPVFNPPSLTVVIDENRADFEIARVRASFPDGMDGEVVYVLLEGDDDSFSVDGYTGGIRLLRPLDAEEESELNLVVGTQQSSQLSLNPVLAHNVSVKILVGDVNDWIPAFEASNYSFVARADTLPGTIIGQVTAFDEDRDPPSNVISYHVVGGGDGHFSVSPSTGLVSVAKSIDSLAGQTIRLRLEARDGGDPSQTAATTVTVRVEEKEHRPSLNLPPPPSPTATGIVFSQRNYSASVSESIRPPYLVMVLPVENKPPETRFVSCSILSGNYRGAFGVTANDGNCELRTQMELDRETIERHLLNISVSSSSGDSDTALVSITVLDANDNAPKFVYDNDLSMVEYLAGVSSDAGPETPVLTVKATDADAGNSSIVRYSLDPLSLHSKYFSVSPTGAIVTRQSMPQLLHATNIDKFNLKILACDSPISGQQLCARTEATVAIVRDEHRFTMKTVGMREAQLKGHHKDFIRTLRSSTGRCSFLALEAISEGVFDGRPMANLTWFSLDPVRREICKGDDIGALFSSQSVAMAAGALRPWVTLEAIHPIANARGGSTVLKGSVEWKGSSSLLVVVAILIALVGIVASLALCFFWIRYRNSQNHSIPRVFPNIYPPTKLETIFLQHPGAAKGYETQMLELPMSDEDLTLKMREGSGESRQSTRERHSPLHYPSNLPSRVSYRNYGRDNYEGDFSVDESLYAMNGRLDTNRLQKVDIPQPDYYIA